MDKYKQLFSNMLIFSFSILLSKLILSFMLPLYTRTMSTSEYGQAELLTNISQMLVPVFSVCMPSAVFRFSMDESIDSKNALKTGASFLPVTIILFLAFSFFTRWIQVIYEYNSFFFFISILTVIRSGLSLYIKSCEKNTIFSIDVLVYNLTLSCFNVILLLLLKKGIIGYFFSIILANVISICFLSIAGKVYNDLWHGKAQKELLVKMLSYSFPIIFTDLAWALISTTDKYMITNQISDSDNGIYSAASKIPAVLTIVTSIFSEAWVLSAIRNFEGDNDRSFYENVFFAMHISVSFVVLLVLALNNTFIPLFLGEQFYDSAKYTPLLLFGAYLSAYTLYYSPLFSACKNTKAIMASTIIGVSANILLNYLLIPQIGIYGACIATVISSFLICLYRTIRIRKYIVINIDIHKWILSVVLVLLVMVSVILEWNEALVSAAGAIALVVLYREKLLYFKSLIVEYIRGKGIKL
ncbi:MAG: polysaccharide biosynthesis C-terminal domain-containing protein [Oscillospiraceae bacterium]|nr:polysaccharide biosynthesis C-terminal domain-containing protein [Oscillospiraceae bacterium]